MLVAPLSVNSSETKEGKQKLIFNKLYKLKKNNNNNNNNNSWMLPWLSKYSEVEMERHVCS